MFSDIFNFIFFKPLYNGLIFLVDTLPFHDLGLAVVILTIIVRFVILPLTHRSVVTQKKMKQIEPEIKKIKEKFKNSREEQARKTMELYRAHGISPFSGFLMLLIQFPILIALFLLLKNGVVGIEERFYLLYPFVAQPEVISQTFLGVFDISKPSYVLAALAGISQFIQIKLSFPKIGENKSQKNKNPSLKSEFQRSLSLQMKYIMPVFIFFIALKFSSGLALYWTTSNVFAIVHEIIVANKLKHGKRDSNN